MLEYLEMSGITALNFRAMASTILNEKNDDEDWIVMQRAHLSGNKTRATYNHARYLDARREMLHAWADEIDGRGV